MPSTYDKGDLLRVDAKFTNQAGTAVDPTTVTFKTLANQATTSYVYGVAANVYKDSVGNYHADISLTTVGTWYVRVESTGTGQAAAESTVKVVSAFG